MSLTALGVKEQFVLLCQMIHAFILALMVGILFLLLAASEYIPTIHYVIHV